MEIFVPFYSTSLQSTIRNPISILLEGITFTNAPIYTVSVFSPSTMRLIRITALYTSANQSSSRRSVSFYVNVVTVTNTS